MFHRIFLTLSLLSLFALSSAPAFAADKTAVSSGTWDQYFVWEAVPPSDGDNILIGGAATVPVLVSTNNTLVTVNRLRIDTGTLNVGGEEDSSAIAVNGGGFSIAHSPGAEGTLTLRENGSINAPLDLVLGNSDGGIGTLNMEGGTFTGYGLEMGRGGSTGVGNIFVSGGSLHFRLNMLVGNSDGVASNLRVGGGTLKAHNIFIGEGNASIGNAVLEGGEIISELDVRIGCNGSGTFEMSGGNLSASRILLGVKLSGATALLSRGTMLVENGDINAREIIVGNKSRCEGTFTLRGGNIIVTGAANGTRLATDSSSIGILNIEGGNFTTTRIHIGIGVGTNATRMRISRSGNVVSSGDVILGNTTDSRNMLFIDGGSLRILRGGNIIVGANSSAGNSTSTLNMTGGLLDVSGDFRMSAGSVTGEISHAFANFRGTSSVEIAGNLSLAPDGSTSGTQLLIAGQASVHARALVLKGKSKLIFSVNSPDFSAKLGIGNTGADESSYGAGTALIIDLAGFSSNKSGQFSREIMSYAPAKIEKLENLVAINTSIHDRGIGNVQARWVDNTSGGRSLLLTFDYGITPEQNDIPVRKRKTPYAIRVVTANLRQILQDDEVTGNGWESRRELCGDVLLAQDADIIGLQENKIPQSNYIMELRPDMRLSNGVYPKTTQAYQGILYSSKRFELLDEGGFWLSDTPDVAGSKFPASQSTRSANWALLGDKYTGEEIYAINTHLDHVGAREEQAIVLRDVLAETLIPGIPQILTGDFNTYDGAAPIGIIKNAGWIDSYTGIHGPAEPGATYHAFKGTGLTTSGHKIDFIFHTDSLTPTTAEIIKDQRENKWPSDHYFVSAEFEYAREFTPPYNNEEEFLLYALSKTFETQADGRLVADPPGSTAHLPRLEIHDDGTGSFSFLPARDDLSYEVQKSTDLRTWTTVETIEGDSSLDDPVSVRFTPGTDEETRLFMRLKILPFINPGE